MDIIRAIFDDQVTRTVILLLLAFPIVDWATGSLRAAADSTFEVEAFDSFVKTQYLGKAIPLSLLIVFGRLVAVAAPGSLDIPGINFPAIVGGGVAAAAPFLLRLVSSIVDNLNPGARNTVPPTT